MQHVLARHSRFRMLVLSVVTLGAGMTTARQADADSTAQNLEKYAELRL